ncbi:hypothetical protein AB0F09_19315 [Streptomyces olivaceus]|uniref:hypothetical protein n=1 Tax=Streptomyces olivaceus TaxID=47716 RepID=UPI00340C849B
MTTRLSPKREAEIAARVNAATAGPWSVSPEYSDVLGPDGEQLADFWYDADGEFMAHAREDVPALLAELAAVRAERDRAKAAAFTAAADLVARYGAGSVEQGLCRDIATQLRRQAREAS